MSDEHVFLNEGDVFVSNSRAILDGTTYSLANITSVRKGQTPPNPGCAILLAIGGALIALIALAILTEDIALGLFALLFGGGLGALGILWLRSLKPTFHVVTSSSSGETQALSASDEEQIDRVVHALSEAIVHRG